MIRYHKVRYHKVTYVDILRYSQLIAHDKMCKRSLRCSVQLESKPIH